MKSTSRIHYAVNSVDFVHNLRANVCEQRYSPLSALYVQFSAICFVTMTQGMFRDVLYENVLIKVVEVKLV